MTNIPKFLQSSIDPTKISLSIESFGKMAGSLILLYATVKGINPTAALQWWQMLMAQAVVVVSSIFAAYNAIMMFWGIVRKGLSLFFPTPATSVAGITVMPAMVSPVPVDPTQAV